MSTKDTGGPAFPSNRDMRHNADWDYEPGMTLRQHYAGLAMQALITKGMEDGHKKGFASVSTISVYAVEYADALIAELAK